MVFPILIVFELQVIFGENSRSRNIIENRGALPRKNCLKRRLCIKACAETPVKIAIMVTWTIQTITQTIHSWLTDWFKVEENLTAD